MNVKRLLRHFAADHHAVRRALPDKAMRAIEKVIAEEERRHSGEIEFAVESSLTLSELLSGTSPRQRAIDVFSRLRVWDTEHNSGVLIYLLLADRQIEIVADRGIHAKVGTAAWDAICGEMQAEFVRGQFERGVVLGIRAISDLLAQHFPINGPKDSNELPDRPIVL